MSFYGTRVQKDIARWAQAGLIDAATASALSRDVEARERGGLGFAGVLAIMAGLLLGAAILLFVAANWEAIPRLFRVGMLFAIIAASYVGGAVLKMRGHDAFGEAAWLVGVAAFGGSIAAIGQMYHLSGDEADAVLVWSLGALIAAAGLRSGPLTVAATALAAVWLFMRGMAHWDGRDLPHLYLLLAAAIWLTSRWTGSLRARHLLALSLIGYALMLASEFPPSFVGVGLAAVAALLFVLAQSLPGRIEQAIALDDGFKSHCLLAFLSGLYLAQMDLTDDILPFALLAAMAFAGIAAAVVLAGAGSRSLRWIAYAGFAAELCIVYGVTIGGMLGTAGFFLAAAILLGLAAIAIMRIERRMASPAEATA